MTLKNIKEDMYKHSPAPWEQYDDDDGNVIIRMDKSHEVVVANLEGSCGTCHANADLIQLAPEILEALERLYDKFASDNLQPIDWYRAAQIIKRVRK